MSKDTVAAEKFVEADSASRNALFGSAKPKPKPKGNWETLNF